MKLLRKGRHVTGQVVAPCGCPCHKGWPETEVKPVVIPTVLVGPAGRHVRTPKHAAMMAAFRAPIGRPAMQPLVSPSNGLGWPA